MTRTQLRIYDIEPGRMAAFLAAWTAGVLPLRRRFGFDVDAWVVVGEDRFVWLLRHGGPDGFEAADDAYYASPERANLAPDPAQWIVAHQHLWLEPVTGTG